MSKWVFRASVVLLGCLGGALGLGIVPDAGAGLAPSCDRSNEAMIDPGTVKWEVDVAGRFTGEIVRPEDPPDGELAELNGNLHIWAQGEIRGPNAPDPTSPGSIRGALHAIINWMEVDSGPIALPGPTYVVAYCVLEVRKELDCEEECEIHHEAEYKVTVWGFPLAGFEGPRDGVASIDVGTGRAKFGLELLDESGCFETGPEINLSANSANKIKVKRSEGGFSARVVTTCPTPGE